MKYLKRFNDIQDFDKNKPFDWIELKFKKL